MVIRPACAASPLPSHLTVPWLLVLGLVVLAPGHVRAADERETFDAHLYVGDSVSSFSASEVRRFENPEDANEVRQGLAAGIDFDYRLKRWSDARALWIYGETVHGLRSTEINCKDRPDAGPCVSRGLSGSDALFVIRNGRSLEAYLGLQWDLARINPGGEAEGRLYVKAQGGFLTVARSGGDFVDNHFAGAGAALVGGKFEGSRLDVGWGRTDLYALHRDSRLKVDGYLTWRLRAKRPYPKGFAEFYVDTDVGRGSDTVLVYLGFELEMDELFKRTP